MIEYMYCKKSLLVRTENTHEGTRECSTPGEGTEHSQLGGRGNLLVMIGTRLIASWLLCDAHASRWGRICVTVGPARKVRFDEIG